jgi:Uncharacterized protein conserved in bacteria (DUF2314)
MSTYQPGDYVKVEFRDDSTDDSEWMWVKVERADDEEEVVFGELHNEPIVNKGLRPGMELAVSYEKIREHKKSADFDQRKQSAIGG